MNGEIKMNIKEKLCACIDAEKDSFISDLKRLVDIKSVREAPSEGKPFGNGPARALEEAEKIAAANGFDMLNMENYVGEISFGKKPSLMLLAHLDVVEAGEGWTRQPYNMSLEGGRAYGRGTTDDKGAALACLYALKAVKKLFGEPASGVRLVMGCGEETGSEDMEYYFSRREKLPFTLSPDADYPVINLEKGRFSPVFSAEPENSGEKIVLEFNGGTTSNIVPCRADVLLGGIDEKDVLIACAKAADASGVFFKTELTPQGRRITAFGKSAHASQPEKGNNAQTALLQALTLLPLEPTELTEKLKALYAVFPHGDTCGSAAGVKMSDEKSGALTLNFGTLSFKKGRLSGSVDLRTPLCANDDNVKNVLVKKLKEAGFVFETEPCLVPVHYVPENAPVIKSALKVYEEYTGRKGGCLAIGGGTYVHGIEGGAAFGIEFPETDYRIHGADEFAVIDELLLTAKMYAAVIYDLCY